jgi:hypothetical protein
MARKVFATSFEKTAAENSFGRRGLFFEGQLSQPQRKAGVYVFYRTSKEAIRKDPPLRILARDEYPSRVLGLR